MFIEMCICVKYNLFPSYYFEATGLCHFYFSDLKHSRNLFEINLKVYRFAFLSFESLGYFFMFENF